MHLSFAHLSDPHNPLTPNIKLKQILNKRLFGYLSWHSKRHLRHKPEILSALIDDIRTTAPDHIVISGDLVNIALPEEFTASRDWLKKVGAPQDVTVVPGNHDAYVPIPENQGIGHWKPWMVGDCENYIKFPFVRRRGPVAFVMLSTSNPTPLFSATGAIGKQQLKRLENILSNLRKLDLFRVVILHHPPEDHPTIHRKALQDRILFREVLARTGAELILHGHQHHSHFGSIPGPIGKIPVLGVPSASMVLNPIKGDEARWNFINVHRKKTNWLLSNHTRSLTEHGFKTFGKWQLAVPFPNISV